MIVNSLIVQSSLRWGSITHRQKHLADTPFFCITRKQVQEAEETFVRLCASYGGERMGYAFWCGDKMCLF